MKKMLLQILCGTMGAVMLQTAFAVSVSANSVQTSWSGATASGMILTDTECPIEVEQEILTFDIEETPMGFYSDAESLLAYSGKVTAEYTFYNPSDAVITAKLLFPFGKMPEYAFRSGSDHLIGADTEKFDITVNGEPIEKTIRHTFSRYSGEFELEKDLGLLHDSYRPHDFYTPEMPVTKYSYQVSCDPSADHLDSDGLFSTTAAFDLPKSDGSARYYLLHPGAQIEQEDGDTRITYWLEEEETPATLYCFGKAPETAPEWHLYKDANTEDGNLAKGEVTLESTETMTFREFILNEYTDFPEDSAVSETDWYNAAVTELDCGEYFPDFGYVKNEYPTENIGRYLMRWYEYEIQLQPGEKIVNTVTAPSYPGFNEAASPMTYEYSYLLSPAKSWKKFGHFQLEIHTPDYIIESTLENLEKTETGYTYQQEGLPDGELIFTTCASQNPSYDAPYHDPSGGIEHSVEEDGEAILWTVLLIGGFYLCCASLRGIIAGACVLIVNRKRAKKK